jgi:hypothetical protein
VTATYAHCQAHVTHADRSWFSTGRGLAKLWVYTGYEKAGIAATALVPLTNRRHVIERQGPQMPSFERI